MDRVVITGGLIASLLVPLALAPGYRDQDPPGPVAVDVVTVNGSGCPQGTSTSSVSPDDGILRVRFSQFTAQVGVGAKPTDRRKNCQMALYVHAPSGFTYAVRSASFRGHASLERGVSARQQANYYFQGLTPTTYSSHDLVGPLDDSWLTVDMSEIGSLDFMPCGAVRYLNINAQLRVTAQTSPPVGTSFITMDEALDFRFIWRRCPGTTPSPSEAPTASPAPEPTLEPSSAGPDGGRVTVPAVRTADGP